MQKIILKQFSRGIDMSLLNVTTPAGVVRPATTEEEDAFIAQLPGDPLSKQILAARKAAEKPPVRKPAAGKNTKASQDRGSVKPKATESGE